MPIALTERQLQAIVTLKRATLSAKRGAAKLDKRTPLRELPGEWQDPVWQQYVQAAYDVVSAMLGKPSLRILDQTADGADLIVSQFLGTLDSTGRLRGIVSTDPDIVRLAEQAELTPVRGIGRIPLMGIIAAAGLGAFFVGRAAFAR